MKMIKFKYFTMRDLDYNEQLEKFQNEHPNAEFIQITGGYKTPEKIWFKYDYEIEEPEEKYKCIECGLYFYYYYGGVRRTNYGYDYICDACYEEENID